MTSFDIGMEMRPGRSGILRLNATPFQLAGLLVILAITFLGNPLFAADTDKTGLINCRIHKAACTQQLPDCRVTLDILPKPVTAMKDLLFRVSITGKSPKANPYINLGMPGMDMGPNRVELKPVGPNIFEGSGIIVRCPSGRRTWSAKVTIPGSCMVEFVFDVVY